MKLANKLGLDYFVTDTGLDIIKVKDLALRNRDDILKKYFKSVKRAKDGSVWLYDYDSSKNNQKKKDYNQWLQDSMKNKPKSFFNKIYKKMGVDMNTEDPDDYKKAEYDYYMKYVK